MVNYKTFELTKNALELIQACIDTKRNPVWVVDNQSGDESTEYLKSLDWIHLIERVPDCETRVVLKRMDLRLMRHFIKLVRIMCFYFIQIHFYMTRSFWKIC
jgi:hypothetical protein